MAQSDSMFPGGGRRQSTLLRHRQPSARWV